MKYMVDDTSPFETYQYIARQAQKGTGTKYIRTCQHILHDEWYVPVRAR